MKLNILFLAGAATIVAACPALAAKAHCGAVEHLEPGETVQQMAARCGIAVSTLLRANDASSADQLEKRQAIAVPQDRLGKDWLDRARNAVVDAGRQIDDAATAAGRSVSDYLKDQPDLNRQVLSFGEKLGLPGVQSGAAEGPKLDVHQLSGDLLSVSASGLPGDQKVIFGWLDGDKVTPLATLQTNDNGRIKTEVRQPAALDANRTVMFVLKTGDGRLRLAADPVSRK